MTVEAPHRPPPIRTTLLGPVDIRVGETILDTRSWSRHRARSTLLLCAQGYRLPRDVVLDALWPDRDVAPSLNALRRGLEPGLRTGRVVISSAS